MEKAIRAATKVPKIRRLPKKRVFFPDNETLSILNEKKSKTVTKMRKNETVQWHKLEKNKLSVHFLPTSEGHLERTAREPREEDVHNVRITRIDQISPLIRLFQLQPVDPEPTLKFRPGQWLDVFIPGILRAGGFTITTPPSKLQSTPPYLELAIQRSPGNPPAAWLWGEKSKILGEEVRVRVGGSFVWPPPKVEEDVEIKRVVFIAGGVGINPLMSMVSALQEQKLSTGKLGFDIRFLYSAKAPKADAPAEEILFLPRILDAFEMLGEEAEFRLFLTTPHKPGLKSNDPPRPEKMTMSNGKDTPHTPELESSDSPKPETTTISDGEDTPHTPESESTDPPEPETITMSDESNTPGTPDSESTDPPKLEMITMSDGKEIQVSRKRIKRGQLKRALGPIEARKGTVCYICGTPRMTDKFVKWVKNTKGMDPRNVLFEKWW